MQRLVVFIVLVFLTMSGFPARASECEAQPKTLAAMQDCYRPLLIFAPAASDASLRAQLAELENHAAELRERNVMVIVLLKDGPVVMAKELPMAHLDEAESAAAWRTFGPATNAFAVVLIGKDGGEKLRKETTLTVAALDRVVDGMPMRINEMRQK